MIKTFSKIYNILTPQEHRRAICLLIIIVALGFVEVLGIGSIMPFMGLLTSPEIINENIWINRIYTFLGFASTSSFMIFSGLCVLGIFLFRNAFMALATFFKLRYSWNIYTSLSERLFEKQLSRLFSYFLSHNSSDLKKNIVSEVPQVITGMIMPALNLISHILISLTILSLLIWTEPVLTLLIFGILGGSYVAIYFCVRNKLEKIGAKRVDANQSRFRRAEDAFGGIKEIKVLGNEAVFSKLFSASSKSYAKHSTTNDIISTLPRYLLESLVVGGMLSVLIYLMIIKQDVKHAIPIFAFYMVAGYRLMPCLQGIFATLSQLRFNKASLDIVYNDLFVEGDGIAPVLYSRDLIPLLSFNDRIQMKSLSYHYLNTVDDVISDLNLTIYCNSSVGFVGPTGAGKTTLIDIILGLLMPRAGCLLVDGVPISQDNLKNWQKNIGYVPQTIYLSDDTITRNIAFGVMDDEIDLKKVEEAARISYLHDFINTELPGKYETVIGDRGIRLSGGQRQRIGIARALYHRPKVLILDEATSALDGITEEYVNRAINDLSGKKTLIIIAHRLSTVKDCDVIYLMDKGRIVAQGTYQDLIEGNEQFRAMARHAATQLER